MQSMIIRVAINSLLTVVVMCLSSAALALDPGASVTVTPLMKTSTTWEGRPIAYPQGKAEITALRVEVAPGAKTGWHSHAVPSFALMLEGTLEVRLENGRTKRLKAGDVLAEVVHTLHSGRNVGKVPVKLVVFYAGVAGQPHTAKPAVAVGSDRDARGCIRSAGYSWCEKEAACVRPWELAKRKGFESTEKNFTHYCSGVGGH